MSSRGKDVETRTRLLNAGARLFADHGYAQVTIRDICDAAHANIAAVNYHFAGKADLYDNIVQVAVRRLQNVTADTQRVAERRNAEERLRACIEAFISAGAASNADAWTHHLMLRELSEPTAALARIMDEVVKPRMVYLRGIVAELLGSDVDDPRASRCAFSIHAQCMAVRHRSVAEQLNHVDAGADPVPAMVEHITEFSLAGLWALARTT